MENLILVQPTKERNGILVRKTIHNINSCELRKISKSGRDNGYIASVSSKGTVLPTGLGWRSKIANSPIPDKKLHEIVSSHFEEIKEIINN